MLVTARESRGLTQSQLAEQARVPQGTISKAEHGLVTLSGERLAALAGVLGFPLHALEWDEEIYGFGSSAFYHRKQKSLPQTRLREIQATFNLTRIRAKRLALGLDIESKHQFQMLDLDDYGSPEETARAVRAMWAVPMGPVKDVCRLIENAGGVVVRTDFATPKISAISQWVPGERPIFVTNIGNPPDRERFTLAHEIAHVLLHSTPHEDQEREADRFASELLMPAAEIGPQLARGFDLGRAAQLKAHWRVSMSSIIRRAKDLGHISESRYTSLNVLMSKRGWLRREPVDIGPDRPRFLDMVIQARFDSGYTVEEVAEVAGLSVEEFTRLYLPDPPGTPVRRLNVVPP
jgi:Zn-dependent peptidase ImmA (M78 family)/transcriptional regulator with XRE-family HTH domain